MPSPQMMLDEGCPATSARYVAPPHPTRRYAASHLLPRGEKGKERLLTCNHLVAYYPTHGRRLPGACGCIPKRTARPVACTERADAERALRWTGHDAAGRHQAPFDSGRRQPRGDDQARPREAALSQSGADPSDRRPLDQEV